MSTDYSTFRITTNETLINIAKKHHKSPTQIALSFLIKNEIAIIPKTHNEERLKENFNILDFSLDEEDLNQIKLLDKNKTLFAKLNLSYKELKDKIDPFDPNRNKVTFSTRFSGPKWEDDFIDLDALINNVVRDCVKDAKEAE